MRTSLDDSITYSIFCFSDADFSLSDAKLDEVGLDVALKDEEATLTMVEDPYLSTEMGDSDQCQDSNAETSCSQLSAIDGPAESSNQPARDERYQSSGKMTAPTGPPPSASASLGSTNPCVENLPASSGPSKEPKDKTVAGNRSDVLEDTHGYLNDSLLPIAIVLSGNNFAKFSLFCKVLNLSDVHK